VFGADDAQGSYTHTATLKSIRNYFFAFLLFNVVLVYTIGGSFFLNINNYKSIPSFQVRFSSNLPLRDPAIEALSQEIVDLLSQSLPGQAIFFTNYLMTNHLMDWG
jgi:hypothetical protein